MTQNRDECGLNPKWGTKTRLTKPINEDELNADCALLALKWMEICSSWNVVAATLNEHNHKKL